MLLTWFCRFLYIVFNLTFLPALVLLVPFLSRNALLRLAPVWGKVNLRLLRVRVELQNAERLSGEAVVYAANHTSTLDTFLYPAILPWRTIYVAKNDLRKHVLLGILIRRAGYIFVARDRSGQGARKFTEDVCNVPPELSIFVHPEGTRIPDGSVRKARSGFASAAMTRHSCVIPIMSEGGSRLWPVKNWFPEPGKVVVRVKEPWNVAEVEASTMPALCARYNELCAKQTKEK